MAGKCMHRLTGGSFCKRWASAASRFCSHHQGSTAHLQHLDSPELHPLARLTTPEDIFDLLRETLNATRLGRISTGQAYAIGYLVAQWRQVYGDLKMNQRETALHRQVLPGLLVEETEREAERSEAPHPLPIAVDNERTIAHGMSEPPTLPLDPLSSYPGWAEISARRRGDSGRSAIESGAAPVNESEQSAAAPPEPCAVSGAAEGSDNGGPGSPLSNVNFVDRGLIKCQHQKPKGNQASEQAHGEHPGPRGCTAPDIAKDPYKPNESEEEAEHPQQAQHSQKMHRQPLTLHTPRVSLDQTRPEHSCNEEPAR